jgi:hypothetical protein
MGDKQVQCHKTTRASVESGARPSYAGIVALTATRNG